MLQHALVFIPCFLTSFCETYVPLQKSQPGQCIKPPENLVNPKKYLNHETKSCLEGAKRVSILDDYLG